MADGNKELAGKVALITGAAVNIGRATAVELAKAGAAVAINTRKSADAAKQVVEEIRAAGGQADGEVRDFQHGTRGVAHARTRCAIFASSVSRNPSPRTFTASTDAARKMPGDRKSSRLNSSH